MLTHALKAMHGVCANSSGTYTLVLFFKIFLLFI